MCPYCRGGEQGNEGEEELLMVLRSIYCWGTKVLLLLLGRALVLGAGTQAASSWRCGVAAGTWQEWPNVSAPRIRAKGHSRNWALWYGMALAVGVPAWQPVASPMGSPCGQHLVCPSAGHRGCTGRSVPWFLFREGSIHVLLMRL